MNEQSPEYLKGWELGVNRFFTMTCKVTDSGEVGTARYFLIWRKTWESVIAEEATDEFKLGAVEAISVAMARLKKADAFYKAAMGANF